MTKEKQQTKAFDWISSAACWKGDWEFREKKEDWSLMEEQQDVAKAW